MMFRESVHNFFRMLRRKAPTKGARLQAKEVPAHLTPSPTHDPYHSTPEPISTSPAVAPPQVEDAPKTPSEKIDGPTVPAAKKAEV